MTRVQVVTSEAVVLRQESDKNRGPWSLSELLMIASPAGDAL